MSVEYEIDYEVGQDNVQVFGMDMYNLVFFISVVLIFVFVIGIIIFFVEVKMVFDGVKGWIIDNFDWLFMVGVNIFVLFCIVLIFFFVGKICLGGKDVWLDFFILFWFVMLFVVGMGIGLMFWSVVELVGYYIDWFGIFLNVEFNILEVKDMVLGVVMYYWGLYFWVIYGVVVLFLVFFVYNKGMLLIIWFVFYLILGECCWGWFGYIIDVLVVLVIIFGLVILLGLGVKQVVGGMYFFFDIFNVINVQIVIIVGVIVVVVIFVMCGLDGGVKLLSNFNMGLVVLLLLFVMIVGFILLIFISMGQIVVDYVVNIILLSNWIGWEDQGFLYDWIVFYWVWWIFWLLFVGMFIVRVFYGCSVCEFFIVVLLVFILVIVVWMVIFGGFGLYQIINGIGEFVNGVGEFFLVLFQMLVELLLIVIIFFLVIVLVLVFFIIFFDFGFLVIDFIIVGGKLDVLVFQWVFWVIMEGLIVGVLLYGGGEQVLNVLQVGVIIIGLLFMVVLLLMCFSFYKGFLVECKLVIVKF